MSNNPVKGASCWIRRYVEEEYTYTPHTEDEFCEGCPHRFLCFSSRDTIIWDLETGKIVDIFRVNKP